MALKIKAGYKDKKKSMLFWHILLLRNKSKEIVTKTYTHVSYYAIKHCISKAVINEDVI